MVFKIQNPYEWHHTFCWFPKQIGQVRVWLGYVERRKYCRAGGKMLWIYRISGSADEPY